MRLTVPFILASQSPRRRHLMRLFGFPFSVHPSPYEETFPVPLPAPADLVQALALEKAKAVAAQHPGALTLGADTMVVLGEQLLGKPRTPQEAIDMLRALSGRTNTVFTGIALVHPASKRAVTAFEQTEVTFGTLSEAEIADYVATGSPLDKAGAYGIQDDQGALYIARIEGDYHNVVGLPVHRLYRLICDEFTDLLA